jgi:drug/metabolite transporter superfamily protein YnfA
MISQRTKKLEIFGVWFRKTTIPSSDVIAALSKVNMAVTNQFGLINCCLDSKSLGRLMHAYSGIKVINFMGVEFDSLVKTLTISPDVTFGIETMTFSW